MASGNRPADAKLQHFGVHKWSNKTLLFIAALVCCGAAWCACFHDLVAEWSCSTAWWDILRAWMPNRWGMFASALLIFSCFLRRGDTSTNLTALILIVAAIHLTVLGVVFNIYSCFDVFDSPYKIVDVLRWVVVSGVTLPGLLASIAVYPRVPLRLPAAGKWLVLSAVWSVCDLVILASCVPYFAGVIFS